MSTEGRISRLLQQEYLSREHALVKHSILEAYLERLFMIVGQSFDVIQFVDCYSGPWQTKSDDLEDSSIGIAIKTMERCKEKLDLMRSGKKNPVEMRALFIEKDKGSFDVLSKFVSRRKEYSVVYLEAWNRDFVESIDDIVKWSGKSFTFFFIDPLGFKSIGANTLSPLLVRPNSEFLINFMFDFINRFYDESDSEALAFMKELKIELFGDEEDELESIDCREDYITGRYRRRLKECSLVPTWTARMRILDSTRERTKYSLIYLTHNPKGMAVFCEETEWGDRIQYLVRNLKKISVREEKSGVKDMFSSIIEEQIPDHDADAGRVASLADIVLRYFDGEVCCTEDLQASILEETDCSVKALQYTLKWLISKGELVNLSAKRARPKNPIHFDKSEKVVRARR